MSMVDVLDGNDELLDGGEDLGECEGFEMNQPHVFIGRTN